MELLGEVVAWFLDPARWSGSDAIPKRLLEHVALSGLAVALGLAIAFPVGLFIGHTGRGALLAIAVANIGRAVPSYALLFVFFPIFGLGLGGFATPFPALVLLAIPPILTNTYVGLRDVDREVVEAARGMGMNARQMLTRVELPIALPVAVAGLRTAAVQVVATATLAALVAGGGLGRYIVDGFALRQEQRLVGGAILVALLALVTERAFTLSERRLVSPGLRGRPEPGGQPYEFAGQAPVPAAGPLP
jgi:osmoprotectant transport system permease protein